MGVGLAPMLGFIALLRQNPRSSHARVQARFGPTHADHPWGVKMLFT